MPRASDTELRKGLSLVRRYVSGDIGVDIGSVDDETLHAIRNHLLSIGKEITLRASDLAKVLQRFAEGLLGTEQLAQWGSFVYHGYPTWRRSARKYPLPIKYEPRREELIAEVMIEIEQIGDVVNGDFPQERASQYLRRLVAKNR